MTAEKQAIAEHFPRLDPTNFSIASLPNDFYNCIAFAAEDVSRWWWPVSPFPGGIYWPAGVPREETLAAFVQAFQTLGYEVCESGELESDWQKVVIFTKAGVPTHAARQLQDGTWVSKLGNLHDIIHEEADDVECSTYGEVAVFMRRSAPDVTNL